MGQPDNELKILYQPSGNGQFLIDSVPGVRDYSKREYISPEVAVDINGNDRIIRITANKYWYKTDDLGQMIYYLLSNKRLLSARQKEADKLYAWVRKSFQADLFQK